MHEVRCPVCGAINRVPRYYVRRSPWCAKCRFMLPEPWVIKAVRFAVFRWRHIAGYALIGGGVLAFWLFIYHVSTTPRPPIPAPSPPPDLIAAECINYPQPDAGLYQVYGDKAPAVAHLTINVGGDGDYFVVLYDTSSHLPVRSFFIPAGQTLHDLMPPGTYTLHYAVGQHWCGPGHLFGDNTDTGKLPKTLLFELTDTSVSDVTVTLYPVLNGNIRAIRIPREQFWRG